MNIKYIFYLIMILFVSFIFAVNCYYTNRKCFDVYLESGFFTENANFEYYEKHKLFKKNMVEHKNFSDGYFENEEGIGYENEFNYKGHRLINGNNLIIGYRAIFRNYNDKEDNFEKISILIKNIKLDKTVDEINISNNDMVFYSKGDIRLSSQAKNYFGYINKGIVRYYKISEKKYKIELFFILDYKMITNNKVINKKYNSDLIIINKEFEAEKKDIDKLTPWEGKKSNDYFEEITRWNKGNKEIKNKYKIKKIPVICD